MSALGILFFISLRAINNLGLKKEVLIINHFINYEKIIITNSFVPGILIYGFCTGMAWNHK